MPIVVMPALPSMGPYLGTVGSRYALADTLPPRLGGESRLVSPTLPRALLHLALGTTWRASCAPHGEAPVVEYRRSARQLVRLSREELANGHVRLSHDPQLTARLQALGGARDERAQDAKVRLQTKVDRRIGDDHIYSVRFQYKDVIL